MAEESWKKVERMVKIISKEMARPEPIEADATKRLTTQK
jgi:hypothetical protein